MGQIAVAQMTETIVTHGLVDAGDRLAVALDELADARERERNIVAAHRPDAAIGL